MYVQVNKPGANIAFPEIKHLAGARRQNVVKPHLADNVPLQFQPTCTYQAARRDQLPLDDYFIPFSQLHPTLKQDFSLYGHNIPVNKYAKRRTLCSSIPLHI